MDGWTVKKESVFFLFFYLSVFLYPIFSCEKKKREKMREKSRLTFFSLHLLIPSLSHPHLFLPDLLLTWLFSCYLSIFTGKNTWPDKYLQGSSLLPSHCTFFFLSAQFFSFSLSSLSFSTRFFYFFFCN